MVTLSQPATKNLQSIACVYPEPLWIFCRGDRVFSDIRELRGLRVATGPYGSGTRRMSEQVLQANGLTERDRTFQVDDRTGFAAAAAMGRGEIDVAFFVTTADAGYVRELIRSPGINLLNLNRQQAYTQLHPWLQPITLAQGVVDLQADLPAQDVRMIAPCASLVASQDLHQAFVPLFLKAAQEAHGGGGMFVKPGDFPNGRLGRTYTESLCSRILQGRTVAVRSVPAVLGGVTHFANPDPAGAAADTDDSADTSHASHLPLANSIQNLSLV